VAPVVIVSAGAAVAACMWIQDTTGVGLGGSSGALVAAALRRFRASRHDTDIAVVCPDGSDRYLGTIYSTAWRERNITLPGPPSDVRTLRVDHGNQETGDQR